MTEPTAPLVNDLNRPFWTAAEREALVLPWCVRTGRFFWPPCPVSPFSTGGGVEWRAAEPTGTLRAITVYRRPFQAAFAPRLPYGVGLVELDAGPRLQAHLADPDAPDAPRPGDRVVLRFEALSPGGPRVPVLARAPR